MAWFIRTIEVMDSVAKLGRGIITSKKKKYYSLIVLKYEWGEITRTAIHILSCIP